MVSIYFNPDQLNTSMGGPLDQSTLWHVADVEVTTLGEAYHVLQNGEQSWVNDRRVRVKPDLAKTIDRSLSAGDVLELAGQRYLILLVGYYPLQPGDTQGPTLEEILRRPDPTI